jgi:uncharacterized protein (TIGR02687 family)
MNQIEQALTRLFTRHRIVFWYDDKQELEAEFNELMVPEVEKIRLANNQFGVKYRVMREEPDRKFLLYHAGPVPPDLENWLLDVQLAYGVFSADQAALWLSELGLGVVEFGELAHEHGEFFQAAKRREGLKALLQPADTKGQVRLKMVAVCAAAEPRLDAILEQLLAELAQGRDERIRLIQRCGLDAYLWEQLERLFGYQSASPSPRDFVIELFSACYAAVVGEPARLANDALVFLSRWKDSVRHQEAFETLSSECAEILGIEQDLQGRSYQTLVDLDYFELIDRKILHGLVQSVVNRTITASDCEAIVWRRRQGHWYSRYQHLYEATNGAANLLEAIDNVDLTIQTLAQGIQQYRRSWYKLDQLYRKVIYQAGQSGQTTLLEPLLTQVENRYTNHFLLPVNDNWQRLVDDAEEWRVPDVLSQRDFFEERVQPFLRKGNKVTVVISDAMRYEIGDELLGLIRQEDRYEGTLEAAVTLLPSFTQLGMAALLPNTTLALDLNNPDIVLVDGQRSQGTNGRRKILENALEGQATLIKAEALLAMTKEESRALIRDHQVLYVYHNRIDATGDKRETEGHVFDAVEDTLADLIKIIKKLAGANANNMLLTADHGFIYQNQALDESDFVGGELVGAEIAVQNRRTRKSTSTFPGLVVRKDLVKTVKGNAIVPSYVLEYLLGQYCATSDEATIQTGIETVKEILRKHYVHRNEAGLVRSNIKEKGRYKVIDKISVALNDKRDVYEATFANLGIKEVLVDSDTVKATPSCWSAACGASPTWSTSSPRTRTPAPGSCRRSSRSSSPTSTSTAIWRRASSSPPTSGSTC